MPYVTDTHPLVYFVSGKTRKLSSRVASLFRKAEAGDEIVFVPVVVFIEINALVRKGEVALKAGSLSRWTRELLGFPGLVAQDITLEIVMAAADEVRLRAPIDAIIVATARHLDLPLITRDQGIIESGAVRVYW